MSTASPLSRVLLVVGFIGMLIGAIDPLEGSLVILPANALVALAAVLAKSRYRTLLVTGFILVAGGVAALWGLSALGGIGGNTGRSMGWGLVVSPYPLGWLLGIVGAILAMIDAFKRHTPARAQSTP
jgi:hypothetical protein